MSSRLRRKRLSRRVMDRLGYANDIQREEPEWKMLAGASQKQNNIKNSTHEQKTHAWHRLNFLKTLGHDSSVIVL